MSESSKPESKVAIVTGGAGLGIGSGVSMVLARHGWRVVMIGRNAKVADQILEAIQSEGGQATFLKVELTDEDAPQRIIDGALEWAGRIDSLVNNAGVGCVAPFAEITDEQYDRVMAINLRAGFRLSRAIVKHLPAPGGSIVNISSVHGLQPMAGFAAYAATKGGTQSLTRGMAVDLGPKGIRVNCVIPGMVDCPQTRQVMAEVVPDVEAYLQQWIRHKQLLPELVANTDVGELVAYLLSPMASGITGQCITIDAGTTLMLVDRD